VAGVLDSLSDLLTYQTAAIYLVDPESDTLPRLRAAREFDGSDVEGLIAPQDSTVVEAMREGHTVGRMIASGALQLAVPLLAGGRALGALEVHLAAALGVDDVKVMELLAATAAVALQNARLYQETQRLATTDSLTGLSNYRHFHELLALEVQRARRMEYPIGFLVMDLDHFKSVNDQHGHPAGDRALQQVAEQFRKRLRRTDVVGRIGGEEFAVILPGDSLDEVSVVAEKLRRAVEELPPIEGGMAAGQSSVTLSVGGTSLEADVVDAQLLMSCADHALYEAKRNGRNQVRLWTDPEMPVSSPQRSA
jgi:diguanylate cyclase (GGDEF)-like protein